MTDRSRAAPEAIRVGHASVLESISDAILAVDAAWRVTYVNLAAERLLRGDRQAMLGRTLDELYPAIMGSAIGDAYREAFESGEYRRVEDHFPRIEAWLDVRIFPHAEGVTFIFRDITLERALRLEMQRAERELREQAGLLRAVIDGLSEGLIVVDARMRVLLMNAEAERFLGTRESRILDDAELGRGRLYLADDVTPVPVSASPLARALDGISTDETRLILRNERHPDGVPLRVSARPLRDGEGVVIGAISWFRDISDLVAAEATRQAMEEELRHAQRMEAMGQLTGGVAHDFNNLLTVIIGNADLLMAALEEDAEAEESGQMILAAAEKASHLVQQLLAFARRQPLAPAVFDPVERLAVFLPLLQRTLGEPIDLDLEGEPGRLMVQADPTQLEAAVLNLCVNARDAMPDGGRVRIQVSEAVLDGDEDGLPASVEPGAYVCVRVIDEGIGMAEEVASQAFEPFFTTKEVGHGSGLGLSMVFGFVRQSRGHLRLESAPGAGTRIELLLPQARADDVLDRQSVGGDDDSTGAPERVLVVEDDSMVGELIRITVEELGYRARMVRNGEQALASAAEHGVDVLLTDLVLPGPINGVELAARMRQAQPGLRVLLMTGDREEAARLPPDAVVLRKPFRRGELAARLRALLGA